MPDTQVFELLNRGNKRRPNPQFVKGVAVFESVEPVVSPATRQIGSLYVAEKDVKKCRTCNRPGHVKKDCPDRLRYIVCRKCKQMGHYQTECEVQVCKHCKQEGHLIDACPTVVCLNCGQVGHRKNACTVGPTCDNCRSPHHSMQACTRPCRSCNEMHLLDECPNPGGIPLDTTTPTPNAAAWTPSTASQPDTPSPGEEDTPMTEAGEGEDEDKDPFVLPDGQQCGVTFTMEHIPQHASAFHFEFQVSYWGAPGQTDLTHKTLVLRLMHQNINGPVKVEPVDVDHADVVAHLNPDTRDKIREVIRNSPANTLRRISVSFVPGKNGQDAASGILGQGFFAPFDLGDFTPLFTTLRDGLRSTEQSVLHFYAVDNGWWIEPLGEIDTDIIAQGENYPLKQWHPDGKINIQSGMQIDDQAIAQLQYSIAVRDRFDSTYEWFTMMFHSTLERLRASEDNPRVETRIRLIRFPGGEDRVYACALEAADDLSLRTDAIINVRFNGEDADGDDDWEGVVSQPMPFLPLTDHFMFLRRPRRGDEFLPEPSFEPDHIIDITAYPTAAELATAVVHQKGIQVWVTERKPRVNTRRELACLNRLFLNQLDYQWELKLFLGNDFTDIPVLDYFAVDIAKRGSEVVMAELEAAVTARKLDSRQEAAVRGLTKMVGNTWLFNGVGGTGKTEIAVALVLYQYKINAHAPEHEACKIVVLTPINAQGDSLAVRLEKVLLDEYQRTTALHVEYSARFPKPKYPVVCRIHAKATEAYVYKDEATQKREKETGGCGPDYVQEPLAADIQGAFTADDMPEMVMDVMVLRTYRHGASTHFDKRLQERELSLGQWMLRRAGYLDAEGEMHPIANPGLHQQFRERLDSFARGDRTSKEDREALTQCANAVAKDLLDNVVDVSIMTHDTYMQARVHASLLPRAVFHDEAGKTYEASDICGYVYSRSTVDGKLSPWVAQLLFGDLLQPKPIPIGSLTGTFAAQGSISLFRRLVETGVGTSWFWVQHRYSEDICATINALIPGPGRLETPPTQPSDIRRRVEQFNLTQLGIQGGVVFLAVKSEAKITPLTFSTYNVEHARRMLWLILEHVAFGFEPTTISIGVPYQAQLRVMIAGRYDLVQYCSKQADDKKLQQCARTLLDMRIVTIDALQGDESEVFVVDTTVTSSLKFMEDQARIFLALSRAKVGLYIIGNPEDVETHAKCDTGSSRRYQRSAYARLVKYCKNTGKYFNLSSKTAARQVGNAGQQTAPFDLSHVSERVDIRHPTDNRPITFSMGNNFVPPPSKFRRLDAQGTLNYALLTRQGREEVAEENEYTLDDPRGFLLQTAEFETQLCELITNSEGESIESEASIIRTGKVVELLNRMGNVTPQLNRFDPDMYVDVLFDDDLAGQPGYPALVTLLEYLNEFEGCQFVKVLFDDLKFADETPEQQSAIQDVVEKIDVPSNLVVRLMHYYDHDAERACRKLQMLFVSRTFPDVASGTSIETALEDCGWDHELVCVNYMEDEGILRRDGANDVDMVTVADGETAGDGAWEHNANAGEGWVQAGNVASEVKW